VKKRAAASDTTSTVSTPSYMRRLGNCSVPIVCSASAVTSRMRLTTAIRLMRRNGSATARLLSTY
jgi:hypothetical protein